MGDHTYTNPNEANTANAKNAGLNATNYAMQGMGQAGGQINQLTRQGIGAATGWNPNSGFQSFQGMAPTLQNLVLGSQNGLQGVLDQNAANQARLGVQAAGRNFSAQGGLHSGAAAAAMGEAAANPFAQVQGQLGGQLVNLTGGLWNQGLGQAYQANQFGQGNLQSALSNAAGLYGNLYGTNAGLYSSGLQSLTSLGQPDYVQNPNWWDYTMQGIGAVTSGIGAVTEAKKK